MTDLIPIPSDRVDDIWHFAGPLVERGLNKVKEYRWNAEDVRFYLKESDMQLWLAADADEAYGIVITQIVITPQARECVIFMIAGRFPHDWRAVQAQVEDWARDMQCTHVSAMSRPGSARINGMEKGLIHTYRRL